MEINEKKLKGILTEQREEYQRYLGVALEHFDSQVKVVAEQYTDIRATLDEHTRILDGHTEMIGSMKTDIEIIKTDIEFIKNSLKRKVDLEEFEALEKRVRLLESKVKV